MNDDAPFQLDHAGFSASFRATREERGWSLAFLGFAPLWTLLVGFGVLSDGRLEAATCCMVTTVPFIWGISAIGAEVAITRRTLRFANGQLELETRKVTTHRQRLELRGMKATVHERFTNKGGRLVSLVLEHPGGAETSISATNWATPDLEELARILNGCAELVDPTTTLVPPEALRALIAGSVRQ